MKWQVQESLLAREAMQLGHAHHGDLIVAPFTPLRDCICEVCEIPVEASSGVRVFSKAVLVVVACNAERGRPGWFPLRHTEALPNSTLCFPVEQTQPIAFRLREPARHESHSGERAVRDLDSHTVAGCAARFNHEQPYGGFARGGFISRKACEVIVRLIRRGDEDLSRPELMSKL